MHRREAAESVSTVPDPYDAPVSVEASDGLTSWHGSMVVEPVPDGAAAGEADAAGAAPSAAPEGDGPPVGAAALLHPARALASRTPTPTITNGLMDNSSRGCSAGSVRTARRPARLPAVRSRSGPRTGTGRPRRRR